MKFPGIFQTVKYPGILQLNKRAVGASKRSALNDFRFKGALYQIIMDFKLKLYLV